jgi:hypothetical protein
LQLWKSLKFILFHNTMQPRCPGKSNLLMYQRKCLLDTWFLCLMWICILCVPCCLSFVVSFFYIMVQFSVLLYSSVLLCCSLLFILLCSSSYYVCVFECIYCTLTLPQSVNPIAVNKYHLYPSIHPSVCPSIHRVSVRPSVRPSIHPSIHLSTYISKVLVLKPKETAMEMHT